MQGFMYLEELLVVVAWWKIHQVLQVIYYAFLVCDETEVVSHMLGFSFCKMACLCTHLGWSIIHVIKITWTTVWIVVVYILVKRKPMFILFFADFEYFIYRFCILNSPCFYSHAIFSMASCTHLIEFLTFVFFFHQKAFY